MNKSHRGLTSSNKKHYKLWLPIGSVIIIFSILELICRTPCLTALMDSDFRFYIRHVDNDIEYSFIIEDGLLMWSPKPEYVGPLMLDSMESPEPNSYDDFIRINSAGFRDREYSIDKPKDTFRIFCLGDSSTFGIANDLSNLYHEKLEERLNRSSSTGLRYEVINAGVTGYSSAQCLNMYRYKGRRYRPDLVTLYIGVNDPSTRLHLSDRQIMRDDIPVFARKISYMLLTRFHFYRLLRKFVASVVNRGGSDEGETVRRVSKEEFRGNLVELNRLCKEDGSVLVIISPPLLKEEAHKPGGNSVVEYRREIEAVAEEYGIHLLTIQEMTERAAGSAAHLFEDSVHPSDKGHELISHRLHDFLTVSELLPNRLSANRTENPIHE